MKKTVFISGLEPEFIRSLNNLGINTLTVNENPRLDSATSRHADCALFSADGKTFFVEQGNYNNIVNYLTIGEGKQKSDEGAVLPVENIHSPYPNDIALNCKTFGRYILCNVTHASAGIRDFALSHGYELIHCNQGYAACSTVKLSDNAAITDDESVYDTLSSIGIDCLRVSKGSVKLKGFDYGFIGGCCGLIEKNKIVFTGSIDKHTDSEMIKEFLSKHNIEYINLTDTELVDIGGIIPLYEIL